MSGHTYAQMAGRGGSNSAPLRNQGESKHQNHQPHEAHPQRQSHPSNTAPRNQQSDSKDQSTGAYTSSDYVRKDAHKPRVSGDVEDTYVLTLLTDHAHHMDVTALRKRYFPPKINKLNAHIALFRALPGSKLNEIKSDIEDLVSRHAPFSISATSPFKMGHGIGVNVSEPSNRNSARTIHRDLASRWSEFLSDQDRSCRPHYTIMNKVDDEMEVARALEEVQRTWKGSDGTVEGLVLYRYERGYWKDAQRFRFAGQMS